jgi:rRNA maturation endonuclease Nob1
MKQKLFTLQCAECKKIFRNPNENKRFCPDCSKIKEKKSPKTEEKSKSLSEVMKDLNEYNQKHGTNLSYGEYVSLVDKSK